MRDRALRFSIMLVITISLTLGGCMTMEKSHTSASGSAPIVVKAITYLPAHLDTMRFLPIIIDEINTRANGEIVFEWVGGPEIIRGNEQPEAVKRGVIDYLWTSATMYSDRVPEVIAMPLSEYTADEERERGFIEFLSRVHEKKMNTVYLGRWGNPTQFYIFTNTPVEKPQDLAGLDIATGALGRNWIKALGARFVSLDEGELHVGMERGLVDGHLSTLLVVIGLDLTEVSDYWVPYPVYNSGPSVCLMNLDTWNRIPQYLQDLIIDVHAEVEIERAAYQIEKEELDKQTIIDAGLQVVTFAPEQAEEYMALAREVDWDTAREKVSPETYGKLKNFLTK